MIIFNVKELRLTIQIVRITSALTFLLISRDFNRVFCKKIFKIKYIKKMICKENKEIVCFLYT